jgi:hypothetical protein
MSTRPSNHVPNQVTTLVRRSADRATVCLMTTQTPNPDLLKVAYANDQVEAEFLQGLLRDVDVYSIVRRAPGFDVPEFLAAGPREVLVAAADVDVARDALGRDAPEPTTRSRADRPSRVLAVLLIALALLALLACVVTGVIP